MSEPDYTEALVARAPVTVRRRVLWSECDPAQVVYTGRFFDYMAAGYGWFFRAGIAGASPKLRELGLGTPMKAISIEFHHMLRPDDWFEMVLRVGEIRTRTFDAEVLATTLEGRAVFTGRMSPIVVDDRTKQSTEIPAFLRTLLEGYRAASSQLTS